MNAFFERHAVRRASVFLILGIAFASNAIAQIPQESVAFAGDTHQATLKGTLKGPNGDARDYVVALKAGQMLTVSLATQSTSTYFNVLAPANEEALYVSETGGKPSFEMKIAADGLYTVRVFLNRAASRKGKASSYELSIGAR